ncbi:hypothetical protein BJ944DRAFT_250965 [Cunninghamella echinulata]|nr:hypothetical protein BJ944DRAFT_250965 [Cunninghamella echinulata]
MTLTSPTYRNGPFYPTSINNHKIPQPASTKPSSHEYTMLFLLPELVHDEEEEEEEEEEDSSVTLASPPSTPPLSSSLSIKRSSSSSTSTSSSFNSTTITKNNMDNSLRKRQKCIPRPSPYASSSDRVFQLPSISSLPSPSLSSPSHHHHLQYIIRDQQLQQQQREEEEEKERDQPLIIYLNHHHHHSSSSQHNHHGSSFSSSSSVTSTTTTSPMPSPTSYLLKAMNESISSPSLTTIPPPSTTRTNNNDHFTLATPLPRLPSSSTAFSIHPHAHHSDNDNNKEKNPILMTTLPIVYNNDSSHPKKKNKSKSLLLSKPIKLNENNNKKNNTSNNNKPFATSSIYSINGIKQEKPPHSTVFSSGRPVRTKGPCQACRESTEACMRKAFDWPFPSDEIYYDKGKPFVYLCNKCGLRYNKSGGSVCRKCRWVLCKEEKRKALQYIEDIRALRPDGKIDLDEEIPSFICTPKYWHCGQPWKVNWILNLPNSSSSPTTTNDTISTITCDTTS